MELKFNCYPFTVGGKVSSNRTFMELKWESFEYETALLHGSNRTFMELKSITSCTKTLPALF